MTRMQIRRGFRFEENTVIETREIWFPDGSVAGFERGRVFRMAVHLSLAQFLAAESKRASEIYCPQAPYSLRFVESHTPPLTSKKLKELEQLWRRSQRANRRLGND